MTAPAMRSWFARDLTKLVGPILERLYVVLAATGVGTTLFTLNVLDGLLQQGLRLLVVPTEESSRLHELLACRQAHVSYRDRVYGKLSEYDARQVQEWEDHYRAKSNLRLLSGSPRFEDILGALDKQQSDALVVDHAHMLSLPGRSEWEGLEAAMVWMQRIAEAIPVIAMVQVHRPQNRDYLAPYRIPSLYSGKGSSKIEQCPDVVLGLSRKLRDDVDAKTRSRLNSGVLKRRENIRDYEEHGVACVTCLKHRVDDDARNRSILLTVNRGKMQDLISLAHGTTGQLFQEDDDAPPF